MFGDVTEEERVKERGNLKKYCELDTWAEVIIIKNLKEIVENNNI